MTKLSEKSLVKRFAKNAAVTVELGGTPENSAVNQKLRNSILRDPDKKSPDLLIYQKRCCTDNKKSPEYIGAFLRKKTGIEKFKNEKYIWKVF